MIDSRSIVQAADTASGQIARPRDIFAIEDAAAVRP
jgi:hypothetical protein